MEEQAEGRQRLVELIAARARTTAAASAEPDRCETAESRDKTGSSAETVADSGEGEPDGQEIVQSEADIPEPPSGPPDKTEADFAHVDIRVRFSAFREYQRTLQEFRRDGRPTAKDSSAFKHLVFPYNLASETHKAHCAAISDISRWQRMERRKEEERLAAERRETTRREQEAAMRESIRRQKDALEAAALRERQEAERRQLAVSRNPTRERPHVSSPEPAPLPLIRGVEFDAPAPSRLYSYKEDGPLLPLERPEEPPLPADTKTEEMLNAMIGECHFLMREVAFRSMCQARVLEDRMSWVGASMKLAKTGASVAKTIGRLRHGPRPKETRHTSTIIQKVVAVASAGIRGEGGDAIP